jgi:hypothetical protein
VSYALAMAFPRPSLQSTSSTLRPQAGMTDVDRSTGRTSRCDSSARNTDWSRATRAHVRGGRPTLRLNSSTRCSGPDSSRRIVARPNLLNHFTAFVPATTRTIRSGLFGRRVRAQSRNDWITSISRRWVVDNPGQSAQTGVFVASLCAGLSLSFSRSCS